MGRYIGVELIKYFISRLKSDFLIKYWVHEGITTTKGLYYIRSISVIIQIKMYNNT